MSGGLGAGGRFWGIPHAHRGVGTAAHAAAIGLGMLDGVCRQVYLQRGRIRVRPVAVRALVGLILVVLALVGLREQRESGVDYGDPVPPTPGD